MQAFGFQISENCWNHIDKYGNFFYTKTSDPQSSLHKENGPAIIYNDGKKAWYINGLLHRENGPAIEYANGTKEWYFQGKLHRENGPAIEYVNGNIYWYFHGKLHRKDGAAIEWKDGRKSWWFDGKFVHVSSQEEFESFLKMYNCL